MLGFLSSLFRVAEPADAGLEPTLLDAAIERAVDGTDRRVRALGNYHKRLRGPVERAVRHVMSLADALPASAEISRRAFGTDPRIRAFFSSVENLQGVIGRFNNVRELLDECAGLPPDHVFGLLVMDREECTVLGTELEGDVLRRDVMQVTVNFCHHRFLAPASTERDTRWELKKRAFDYLIERALERLTSEKRKRGDMEQQRRLLRRKLEAMQTGGWGLGSMIRDQPTPSDLGAVEAEIEAIDAELGRFGTRALSLEQSLECIADTVGAPERWLAARRICLCLDYRGIKRTDASSAAMNSEIELTELYSSTGLERSVLLGHIPRSEIPEPPDMLKRARHYLA